MEPVPPHRTARRPVPPVVTAVRAGALLGLLALGLLLAASSAGALVAAVAAAAGLVGWLSIATSTGAGL